MKIKLKDGTEILIDDEDYELVSQYKWHKVKYQTRYYIQTHVYILGKRNTTLLHRVIMKAKKGQQVDHINHNGFDNRKENLRFCSYKQNQQNRKQNYGKSPYKGEAWNSKYNKWKAHIGVDNKQIFLGYFGSEIEAAQEYDKKAEELFGEFAYLNFRKGNDTKRGKSS